LQGSTLAKGCGLLICQSQPASQRGSICGILGMTAVREFGAAVNRQRCKPNKTTAAKAITTNA